MLYINYLFIRGVRAVDVAVAPPALGDAVAVPAAELWLRVALVLGTVLLVAGVAAVVLTVAEPTLLDALPVAASELVPSASLVWKQMNEYFFVKECLERLQISSILQ